MIGNGKTGKLKMFSSLLLKKAGGNITRSNRLLLRYISDATRDFLKTTVADNKVVVFMKGTPDAPQCGFSRAVVQILRTQGLFKTKKKNDNLL